MNPIAGLTLIQLRGGRQRTFAEIAMHDPAGSSPMIGRKIEVSRPCYPCSQYRGSLNFLLIKWMKLLTFGATTFLGG